MTAPSPPRCQKCGRPQESGCHTMYDKFRGAMTLRVSKMHHRFVVPPAEQEGKP